MEKKDLNISLAIKMLLILDLYAHFFQKWVHIEKTLTKLNIFFNKKRWIIARMHWNLGKVSIKKEFDNELVFNEKYLKVKLKSKNTLLEI